MVCALRVYFIGAFRCILIVYFTDHSLKFLKSDKNFSYTKQNAFNRESVYDILFCKFQKSWKKSIVFLHAICQGSKLKINEIKYDRCIIWCCLVIRKKDMESKSFLILLKIISAKLWFPFRLNSIFFFKYFNKSRQFVL